jgi:hypothetical protein
MNSQNIVMCVVALILGMLLANMLKSVCGCKVVEGQCGSDPFSDECRRCYESKLPGRLEPICAWNATLAAWENCGGARDYYQ